MNKPNQCPLCESKNIDQDVEFADGICAECGFVISDSKHPVEQEHTENIDRPASSESSEEWDNSVEMKDASDRNLVELLSMTDSLREPLLLSTEARVRSAEVVTEGWRKNVLHGRSMSAGAGASVHLACRELKCPRPASIVVDAAQVDSATLRATYGPLVEVLGINLDPPRPAEFIPFICESLGHPSVETSATQILLENQTEPVVGNPAGSAAAAVYLAIQHHPSGDKVTYREAAQAIGMTKETVWKRTSELRRSEHC